MKFFADECCDAGIVASLRKEGYDVIYALEEEPGFRTIRFYKEHILKDVFCLLKIKILEN